MMVVLVGEDQEGLDDLPDAPARRAAREPARRRPAGSRGGACLGRGAAARQCGVVVYTQQASRSSSRVTTGELDAALVERLAAGAVDATRPTPTRRSPRSTAARPRRRSSSAPRASSRSAALRRGRRGDAPEEHVLLSRSSSPACSSTRCDRLARHLPRGRRGRPRRARRAPGPGRPRAGAAPGRGRRRHDADRPRRRGGRAARTSRDACDRLGGGRHLRHGPRR